MYRSSLSKLVNHLSWRQKIVVPKTLGPDKTLMRIDFRDYKWTPATWLRIVVAYPYGVRDFAKQCDQIKALCGAELPYCIINKVIVLTALRTHADSSSSRKTASLFKLH